MGDVASLGDLNQVFGTFISRVLTLIGILGVIMIIVAGYKYLFAGSDKDGATKAKNTFTYVFFGLVLAVSAWMIINLVGRFLGADLSTFNICFPGAAC